MTAEARGSIASPDLKKVASIEVADGYPIIVYRSVENKTLLYAHTLLDEKEDVACWLSSYGEQWRVAYTHRTSNQDYSLWPSIDKAHDRALEYASQLSRRRKANDTLDLAAAQDRLQAERIADGAFLRFISDLQVLYPQEATG